MKPAFRKASAIIGATVVASVLGYVFRSSEDASWVGGHRPVARQEKIRDRFDSRGAGRPLWFEASSPESRERLAELEALAASDPGKALAKLPFFRDTDLLPPALGAIARGWAGMDPDRAAKWVASLESAADQVSSSLGLVPVWAAEDPEACLTWAVSLTAGDLREVSLVELADTWASIHPELALGRYLALDPDLGSERGLHGITSQWVLDDPDRAIDHIAGLGSSNRRDEFLETALVSLTNQDPDRVWREASRFDDDERVRHVRCMALEAMAETRPLEALRLSESVENPAELLKAVARGWSSADPVAAGAWLASLTDRALAESLRDEASP